MTFYSWIEGRPSNVVIHISGGTFSKDPTSGAIFKNEHKEVKFRAGAYLTSDPEIIAALRRQIEIGADITEDQQLYLSRIEKPNDERLLVKNQGVQDDNVAMRDEIDVLKKKLLARKR